MSLTPLLTQEYELSKKMNDVELFAPLCQECKTDYSIGKPPLTFWQDGWIRFRKNKIAVVGMILLILISLFALVGPFLVPYTYESQDL